MSIHTLFAHNSVKTQFWAQLCLYVVKLAWINYTNFKPQQDQNLTFSIYNGKF